MTANELADKLQNEKAKTLLYVATIVDSANMLRQQQEKIDRLLDQYQQLNENLEMWKTGHFKQQAEIETLKQRLELAEWDEEKWKKFKQDNYEVIELKPRSEK
jgi:uncharacterized protein YdcH (DUF465 family)